MLAQVSGQKTGANLGHQRTSEPQAPAFLRERARRKPWLPAENTSAPASVKLRLVELTRFLQTLIIFV